MVVGIALACHCDWANGANLRKYDAFVALLVFRTVGHSQQTGLVLGSCRRAGMAFGCLAQQRIRPMHMID